MKKSLFVIETPNQKVKELVDLLCLQYFLETSVVSSSNSYTSIWVEGDNLEKFQEILRGFEINYEFGEEISEGQDYNYDYYLGM